MPKHIKPNTVLFQKTLSFSGFWLLIASEVGACKLDLNPSATCIDELFSKNAVHPEHLKKIIINSLPNKQRSSANTRFNGYIDLCKLLDALGEAAFELRKNSADDLFDIELLEEIAWHISERFSHHLATDFTLENDLASPASDCDVLNITHFKRKTTLNKTEL